MRNSINNLRNQVEELDNIKINRKQRKTAKLMIENMTVICWASKKTHFVFGVNCYFTDGESHLGF